jgi:hypothetical protein
MDIIVYNATANLFKVFTILIKLEKLIFSKIKNLFKEIFKDVII